MFRGFLSVLSLASPAKLNLFLKVLRRRPDGFHDLASLFQAISLHDLLHVGLADQDALTCDVAGVPTDRTNLIVKAAELFRQKTGLQAYVNVHLEKRIPMEAGLGGGSSNAATTLWALNELTGRPAPLQQLQTWAGDIGSDVAFFLSEGTAYCTGRGECLMPLPPLAARELTLVKPPEGLSTPSVFKALNVSQLPENDPQSSLESWARGQPICFNDLEYPAFRLMPALQTLKQTLRQSFETVLMSGSGTSFFCLGNGQCPPRYNVYSARFVNRLPGCWYPFSKS
jgi:4-diphosphocytidyl-2-C-methyl-D-erythritol kinase